MDINAYQVPQQNEIYIQQNLITSVNQQKNSDNIGVFINQDIGIKKINDQYVFPLSSEIGLELNHYIQTSMSCSYLPKGFNLKNDDQTVTQIDNFWYCGNAFAVVPFASSVFHPKLKIFGGAGQAYGTQKINDLQNNVSLNFWTIKPTLSGELNIFQNFKLSLGAGYQFLFANNSAPLQKEASGIEAQASLTLNLR